MPGEKKKKIESKPKCPRCDSKNVTPTQVSGEHFQGYRCQSCGRYFGVKK